MTDTGFRTRLKEAMDGRSPTAFAKLIEIPPSTLRSYLDEDSHSSPSLENATRIAEGLGVSLRWLATGAGHRTEPGLRAIDDHNPVQVLHGADVGEEMRQFTLVPRYDVSASAGFGLSALAEEVAEHLAFRTEWLHDMGLSPAFVGLVTCRGNSQDPVIKDGAIMLVDMRPDQLIRSGCFYIIVLDGDVLVKLINRRVDGTIELKSINPEYPTEVIDIQQLDRLRIPGQVVWAGQKL
ncbi:S24 family peptidase [Devosia sp.]|uniref:LexA family transcriptional regulator n=1 Tax=Devosia sp. TaxID=1871048 RepID=UPI001ACF6D3B|nr:S24 family peptidase [Devosia sp.]MBN9333261.1 helix-turn-helix domain-containing protein [Devosia sp.]